MEMKNEKKELAPKTEKCIICGARTEYFFETPISQRQCFVEGAGQLCPKFFKKIYGGGVMS